MRIIAFGDIHMALGAWQPAMGQPAPDLVVITGDLTNFGHRGEAAEVLAAVRAHYQGPLLAVPGNLDHGDVNDLLNESGISLHGRGVLHQDIGWFGVGGSNPTPFHTPLEFSEQELDRLLRRGHAQVEQAEIRILVSHAPPYGTRTDRLGNGAHAGSLSLREFILEAQPDLCLCGHIHEARGEDRLGKTLILNPGLSRQGGWIGIDIAGGLRAGLELKAGGAPQPPGGESGCQPNRM